MVPIWTSGPSCCAPSSSCKRHLPTLRESAPLVSGITHRKSKMLRVRKQRNNLYPILKLQKFHRGIWNSGSSCSDTFQSAVTQGRLLNYPCHIFWTSGQLPTRNISLNISRDSSDEQKLRFKTKGNIKHWKWNNMKQPNLFQTYSNHHNSRWDTLNSPMILHMNAHDQHSMIFTQLAQIFIFHSTRIIS